MAAGGRGWPRMAAGGRGWPRMAAGGRGWQVRAAVDVARDCWGRSDTQRAIVCVEADALHQTVKLIQAEEPDAEFAHALLARES